MENKQETLLELSLFAGAGGGILGGKLLGWRCIGAVECEEYPCGVLAQRQNDNILDPFPIWDDVCTFRIDNPDTREYIEDLRSIRQNLVISGGFPCQDISAAGKGEGITGSRSGLWGEMARIIGEIQPRYVWMENSPLLVQRGLGLVLLDLAKMGYDARWGIVGADDAGAPHKRKRIWVLAYAKVVQCNGGDNQSRRKCKESGGPVTEGCVSWWHEDPAELGDSNNYGHVAPEECKGIAQGSNRGATRQEQTCELKGSSEPQHEDVADADSVRSETRVSGQEPRQEGNAGEFINEGEVTWWHSDPADIPDTGLPDAQGREEFKEGLKPEDRRETRSIPAPPGENVGNTPEQGLEGTERSKLQGRGERFTKPNKRETGSTQPRLGRVAHGVAHRVDRLKAIGNGQVPAVVELAWKVLTEDINQ